MEGEETSWRQIFHQKFISNKCSSKFIPNKCFFLMDSLWQLITSTISRVGAGKEWSTVEETGLSRRSWVYKFSYQAGLRCQQCQKLSKCGKLIPSYFSFLIRKHACATSKSIKLNLLSWVLGRQKWVSPQSQTQSQSDCSHSQPRSLISSMMLSNCSRESTSTRYPLYLGPGGR